MPASRHRAIGGASAAAFLVVLAIQAGRDQDATAAPVAPAPAAATVPDAAAAPSLPPQQQQGVPPFDGRRGGPGRGGPADGGFR